ncbi:aldolase/citrate lyase family protein [Mesorhizobium sp.]|uniref:HpcH/HpaI aldolase family protein n=1 Tax=Mesorhizobium sp. TaxID=1871066 RepID=UPI0025DC7127|nr:aldolase/citrate lyase family protein [Mesorhizobium sp.]
MTVIRMANRHTELAFWLMTPNENACEIASILGYSTVIIDMEHGTFEPSTAARSITLAKAFGLTVYTRVDSAERVSIQHALDFGSDGVILPQIAGVAHARAATAFAKFPPLGARGFGGGKTVNYAPAPGNFVEAENRRTKCWVMIETAQALEEVEQIADLKTVDGLFIGPNDLSLARGRGEYVADGRDHDDIRRIANAAIAKDKPWAMPISSARDRDLARSLNIGFMATTDDVTALRDGLAAGITILEQSE